MGSCFSKRKKSDAAVTHDSSPPTSFSLSSKEASKPSPPVQKPSDQTMVLMTKDSAPLPAKNRSSSLRKSSSKNVPCRQQLALLQPLEEDSRSKNKLASGFDSETSTCGDDNTTQCHHSDEASLAADKLPCRPDGGEPVDSPNLSLAEQNDPPDSLHEPINSNPISGNVQVAEDALLSVDDEFVIDYGENEEMGILEPALAKLKRSRSCEESMRVDSKRPLRRKSFQETSTIRPRSKLETISEPKPALSRRPCHEFGTTKYLEGLHLVDFLPSKSAQNEAQQNVNDNRARVKSDKPTVLDLQHESNGLSEDFFEMKNRYLSSCSAASQSASYESSSVAPLCCISGPAVDDGMTSSFALMHSRASSLDSAEVANIFHSVQEVNEFHSRHPISAVEEEDEEECFSDDSETFVFKQAVSIFSQQKDRRFHHMRNQKQVEPTKPVPKDQEEEKEELGRYKELSVVSTGDAVLFAASNSEEFDLIPSKSFIRNRSLKAASNPCAALAATNQNAYHNNTNHARKLEAEEQDRKQQCSLSVEDIICMLERDELDDEVLLSFLNVAARNASGGGSATCPASDVASEAGSFEFKVRSAGSTPHSTPSTPMLSAGSTPKRITQLSPLALTPEEIAEIWGVFEQRQALSYPS